MHIELTAEQRRSLDLLAVPFDPAAISWRVTNKTRDGKRGCVIPYGDQRAYTDRLNSTFSPAGWTRSYEVTTLSPVSRTKKNTIIQTGKVIVTCVVTVHGLGSHSGTGGLGREGGKRRPQHDVIMLAKRAARDQPAADQAAHMDAAAAEWLLDRAPSCGLLIDPDSLIVNAYTQHRIRRKDRLLSFSSIDYTGVAEVTDPDRLATAMLSGVGRKRGFGCGLLLVRRML